MGDSSALFTLVGVGLMVWLYIRLFLSVLRTEKHTKETAEHTKRLIELAERKNYYA